MIISFDTESLTNYPLISLFFRKKIITFLNPIQKKKITLIIQGAKYLGFPHNPEINKQYKIEKILKIKKKSKSVIFSLVKNFLIKEKTPNIMNGYKNKE